MVAVLCRWVYAIKAVLRLTVHVRRLSRYEGLLEGLVSKSSSLVEYIELFHSLQQYRDSALWKKILIRVSGRLGYLRRRISRLEQSLSESEVISLRRFHNHEIQQMLEDSADETVTTPKVQMIVTGKILHISINAFWEGEEKTKSSEAVHLKLNSDIETTA